MEHILFVVIAGFMLDLMIGDPYWMPHPVRGIGYLISKGEKIIRPLFPKNKKGENISGAILTISVICLVLGLTVGGLKLAYQIHDVIGIIAEIVIAYQVLATKSLKKESVKVYDSLKNLSIEESRKRLSMIVGRDTTYLNEKEIAKATIETIAENTTDGIIAPLFYLMIGGIPLGITYKVINTFDSMIGYRNDKYKHFGTFAAKLDDVVNYIPARLGAYIMILASYMSRYDGKNAYKIYKRDRYNHKSPNSAHTESVCAGALQIQLAGDAYYFGKKVGKPTIGDVIRNVETEDIKAANQLMYVTAILSLIVFAITRLIII